MRGRFIMAHTENTILNRINCGAESMLLTAIEFIELLLNW